MEFNLVVTMITRLLLIKRTDQPFRTQRNQLGRSDPRVEADKVREQKPELVIKEDAGRGYRRVVPSPDPKIIAERTAIRALIDAGFIVVACGEVYFP